MLIVRSIVFNLLFYIITAGFVILGSPLLIGPRAWAMAGLRAHARATLWLLRTVAGIKMEVRGRENLLPGPILVASKHQSAWDTIALIPLFKDPAMVMKRELFWIPFHGWFSSKFRMIPVDRAKGPSALKKLLRIARDRAAAKREIVIFPEGTRKAPGAPDDYKSGIVLLYEGLNLPVCPVALNSGLFWPRRQFLRYPGTIIVEFLEPIPPGLHRKRFLPLLRDRIEQAGQALLEETAGRPDAPPLAHNFARSHANPAPTDKP